MSNNNDPSNKKMNQTMSTNYELKKPGLQTNQNLSGYNKSSSHQFFSNIQNIQNVSQNVQNQFLKNQFNQQNETQSNDDLEDRQTLKATSSMISEFTHFKKQKIQNLINEQNLNQLNNEIKTIKNSTDKSGLNFLNQLNRSTNDFKQQLNSSYDNQMSNYSESISSSDSNYSPEPVDYLPVNLSKLNKFNQLNQLNPTSSSSLNQDSSSSSENKEDNHQGYDFKVNDMYLANKIQSTNKDGKKAIDNIELVFVKQPAKYHRARYMTEGSRGPIRDKSGKSFPTIKLLGYDKQPVKAICYLTDENINQPHLFYQASKLTSRCLTNCVEVKFGNTIGLQFELNPRNDMELMIDCLGIVKQRLFEIQQKQHNQESKSHFKTPFCRLVFEAYIDEHNLVAKTYSETIHCKQMMRAPEIHRMSIKECLYTGDKELFIIGKNFTRDLKLYFKYENQWQESVTPVKELFHQAHLVCNVPKIDLKIMNSFAKQFTDKDGQQTKRLTVELYAVCDNKQSGKEQFTYYM